MTPSVVLLRFVYGLSVITAQLARGLEAIYPVEAAGAAEYARMLMVEL